MNCNGESKENEIVFLHIAVDNLVVGGTAGWQGTNLAGGFNILFPQGFVCFYHGFGGRLKSMKWLVDWKRNNITRIRDSEKTYAIRDECNKLATQVLVHFQYCSCISENITVCRGTENGHQTTIGKTPESIHAHLMCSQNQVKSVLLTNFVNYLNR